MKLRSVTQCLYALIAAGVCTLAISGSAGAATACCGNLRLLYFSGDAIRNYDFTEQTVAADKVDWGAALLFYNNANINKIKNALSPYGYTGEGASMNGRLSDTGGASYVWDTDKGKKKGGCYDQYTHYRIYAHPSYDYMYNPAMGYFLFGTPHYDATECLGGASGWSEDAEHDIALAAYSAFGASNQEDWANFYNNEPYRSEGCCHVWLQDGRASYVSVP